MGQLVRRLWSPAGFILVGLCFLLPFVAVSCDTKLDGKTVNGSITLTGKDLVVGGKPEIYMPTEPTPGVYRTVKIDSLPMGGSIPSIPRQPLALLALCLIVAGVLAAVLPWTRWRTMLSAALALSALGALEATYRRTEDVLVNMLTPLLAQPANTDPLRGLVKHRYGLWLAMGLLIVIAAANADTWVRTRKTTAVTPTVSPSPRPDQTPPGDDPPQVRSHRPPVV